MGLNLSGFRIRGHTTGPQADKKGLVRLNMGAMWGCYVDLLGQPSLHRRILTGPVGLTRTRFSWLPHFELCKLSPLKQGTPSGSITSISEKSSTKRPLERESQQAHKRICSCNFWESTPKNDSHDYMSV